MTITSPGLRRFGALVGIGVAVAAMTTPAQAAPPPSPAPFHFELTPPAGSHPVGVVDLHLVDRARSDPWVDTMRRELMVTIRYPAARGHGRPAPFMTSRAADAVALADANMLNNLSPAGPSVIPVAPTQLDYEFATDSRTGAAVAGRGHRRPVVLYSPGTGRSRAFGTVLTEHLASRGYIVVSIDHTHEAVAVEFPDGRLAQSRLPASSTAEVLHKVMDARVADTRFVLDQLGILARGGNPDEAHRRLPAGLGTALDLSRVGMFGHSAGGFTAGETMVSDRRIDAGADLDGSMMYSRQNSDFGRVADEGLDRPFLLMSAGNHSADSDPSWQRFLSTHRGWLRQLHMPAGEHFSYTDYQLVIPQLIDQLDPDPALPVDVVNQDKAQRRAPVGTVDPTRSIAAQRAYLTAFFDEHLRRLPQPLLDGESPEHPDVDFQS